MHIGFVNYTPITYTVRTPYEQPLGGSESSMLYLAAELVKRGHEVTVFGKVQSEQKIDGVWHRGNAMNAKDTKSLDALILQNTPVEGKWLRTILPSKTKLLFWSQHAHDQKAIEPLTDQEIVKAFDACVCISFWQFEQFLAHFPLQRRNCTILRNAISPSFESVFQNPEDVVRSKKKPIMAYTSVPFRGLEHMIEIWPKIRESIPTAEFHIFSSMQVYQMSVDQEKQEYQRMYEALAALPGVHYFGSLPQRELAQRMREVAILAYPNTFAETSCIAAMEAMAAGAHIVSTQLGALPETTAGFADLIPLTEKKEEYISKFVECITRYWNELHAKKQEITTTLGNQIYVANKCYTWSVRAKEWEQYLLRLLS